MKNNTFTNINKRHKKRSFSLMKINYKPILLCLFLLFFYGKNIAQLLEADTVQLSEVIVHSYLNRQSFLKVSGAVNVVDTTEINRLTGNNLVPLLNALPGVRLEERSPSSYRISLRGSLLRSPFGVRNVKIYYRDFPLTDASGNTYFNVLSRNAIENIEVLKGPDGSIFGANSGGVITLNNGIENYANELKSEMRTGSFNFVEENILWRKNTPKNSFRFTHSFDKSDNYRINSASRKIYFDINNVLKYSADKTLEVMGIYSKLNYQTPGGLNNDQWKENPQAARPATSTLPGSEEQKNGTDNNFFYGGIRHQIKIKSNIENNTLGYANYADYTNRFITNYEIRKEFTAGWRSYFSFKNRNFHPISWMYIVGTEGAQTRAKIINYDNNLGISGELQSAADILTLQHFYFNKIMVNIQDKLNVDAALSLNFYQYYFINENLFSKFAAQWMPRFAFSYMLKRNLVWRSSVSKGYSPPTNAEIRPSDNQIYPNLQPEKGWNYETGLRWNFLKKNFFTDVSLYHYELKDAIVRRTNESGAEYFTNSGNTKQTGIEFLTRFKIITQKNNFFVRKLEWQGSFTKNIFYFKNYLYNNADYSGNKITGVPDMVWANNVFAEFPKFFTISAYHNYTSALPLNDGNTAFTNPYNIVQIRVSKKIVFPKTYLVLNTGVDNLFNTRYSLGNDINAFGGRYYNPAPARNFWVGAKIGWK